MIKLLVFNSPRLPQRKERTPEEFLIFSKSIRAITSKPRERITLNQSLDTPHIA
jgi:hypothetical protein